MKPRHIYLGLIAALFALFIWSFTARANEWAQPNIERAIPAMWDFVVEYHNVQPENRALPDIRFKDNNWFVQNHPGCRGSDIVCPVVAATHNQEGHIVFNKAHLKLPDAEIAASFLVHEMVHVVQFRRNMLNGQPCWAVEKLPRQTQVAWLAQFYPGVTAGQIMGRIGFVQAGAAC